MKTLRILFVSVSAMALATACALGCADSSGDATSAEGEARISPEDAERATFSVDGMTCASCTMTVEIAAERTDGVLDAEASYDEERARVTYDPERADPGDIAEAITSAGYEASPRPAAESD